MQPEYQTLREEGKYTLEVDEPTVELRYLGKRGVKRHDGYAKASGAAHYTRDVVVPGMLVARVMRSPYAHAKIIRMDTEKAEALPGVSDVLRYDDPEIEGRKLNGSVIGPDRVVGEGLTGFALKPDRTILAEEAWFEGQMVGALVVAATEEIADQALRAIEVEWEVLPFVLDQEEALKPESYVLRPDAAGNKIDDFREIIVQGDVEQGFRESDRVVEFKARRHAHLWAGAEMPSVIARWSAEDLELWAHVQQPYPVKLLLGEQLDIPMKNITIHTPYQGCSFGERCNPADYSINGMHVLATLAARKLKQPVKLLFDRAEKFYGASGDVMVGYFKVGFNHDGTINAVHMNNVFAVWACTTGIEHFKENTRIPHLKCENTTADVSKPPTWWCRCEQLPNTFCFTLIFEHVAAALKMDPTEVALKNDGCEGKDMSYLSDYKKQYGFRDIDSLKECIEKGKKAIGWDEKWHPPGTRKLANGRMHGLAFTWTHEWDDVRGMCSAAVQIENDGTATIIGQHCDIGTNPWTSYRQIAADELGIPFEDITIKPNELDHGFVLMSPDGSCNLTSNGFVIKKAARKAKKMLLELAAEKFGNVTHEALDIREGVVFEKDNPENSRTVAEIVTFSMPGMNAVGIPTEPPVIGWAWHDQGLFGMAIETNRPRLARQAHFIEIEVDVETGEIEVKKVVNVNDVGRALSPESIEGQMYGGTYMGVGRATMEEMVWDEKTGVLLNRDLLNYKFATILDCGPIDTIVVESGLGHGPYGTVGVGEDVATVVPALLGPAVYNAIGVFVDDFPITPAKVLKALD
ncbi:MAG: xanthine dehydrogenase family protein molybdopterin-binding subunit [Proteobacteria bacterium]|nr:xanthine dehydrogenase family protein molybdopterin-binding subunit [Pseudomonadota bacterium]